MDSEKKSNLLLLVTGFGLLLENRCDATAGGAARRLRGKLPASGAGANVTKLPCDIQNVEGFLIDLDGTMYDPAGILPGAKKFHNWLVTNNKPFVFLSNSPAKGPDGVQNKFLTPPFVLSNQPVPLSHIRTAATAVSQFLYENAPEGSHLYILESGYCPKGRPCDSCIRVLKKQVPKKLLETWDMRTDLDMDDIYFWANRSTNEPGRTFVVSCNDGPIQDIDGDPVTNKIGYKSWSQEMLTKAAALIENGALLVSAAPDSSNVLPKNPKYPNITVLEPGPGAYENLLKAVAYPKVNESVIGKGGVMGTKYMIEGGIQQLRMQGFRGGKKNVAMVGDRLDTDIIAGVLANISSIFVLSGVHSLGDMSAYPDAVPSCILPSVGEIPDQFV